MDSSLQHIKSFSDFLNHSAASINELGEGTTPFNWEANGDLVKFINWLKTVAPEYGQEIFTYSFTSDKDEYLVNAQTVLIPPANLNDDFRLVVAFGFMVKGDDSESNTNYQEQYRVISTVMEIIADYVNTANTIEGIKVIEIQIAPKSDSSKLPDVNSKRGKLYRAYIEKNLNKLDRKYTAHVSRSGLAFVLVLSD